MVQYLAGSEITSSRSYHHRSVKVFVPWIDIESMIGYLDLKKVKILYNRLLIGVDSGVSLTKVIFLSKGKEDELTNENRDTTTLHYGVFNNDDFEDAIKWVKENAYIAKEKIYTVHVTGSRMTSRKIEIVELILGLKSQLIDPTLALIAGHKIGVELIGLQNLIAPNVEIEDMGEAKSPMLDRLFAAMKARVADGEVENNESNSFNYPCLIQICGSQSRFVYFNKDGKGEVLKCQSIGGLTMLGLGKCLLDTNNYDEIMKLAEKGNRANVDTQTKDVLSNAKDTPYGIYPPEMPLFPFGKCMDFNTGLEHYKKEDVASSLVAFYCILIITEYFHICREKAINKIYLAGNVFRYNVFQKSIKQFLKILPPIFEMEILNFGFARTLGAMLCENEESYTYCITDPQ